MFPKTDTEPKSITIDFLNKYVMHEKSCRFERQLFFSIFNLYGQKNQPIPLSQRGALRF